MARMPRTPRQPLVAVLVSPPDAPSRIEDMTPEQRAAGDAAVARVLTLALETAAEQLTAEKEAAA